MKKLFCFSAKELFLSVKTVTLFFVFQRAVEKTIEGHFVLFGNGLFHLGRFKNEVIFVPRYFTDERADYFFVIVAFEQGKSSFVARCNHEILAADTDGFFFNVVGRHKQGHLPQIVQTEHHFRPYLGGVLIYGRGISVLKNLLSALLFRADFGK